jgi:hypothetical protein
MLKIRVPEKCLICGAEYRGGHALPNEKMEFGKRVFYDCGASMSVNALDENTYQILYKNCGGSK